MKLKLTLLLSLLSFALASQVITPFTIRYQATQKGGIRYISNTSVTCSGVGCGAGRTEVPPAGTSTDNGFNAAYVDIDADGTTFSSSSDSLALPLCSEISWAGLYWGGENTTGGSNYATRNQVRIKLNNGAYQNITATSLQDNAIGFDTYHCFSDVTSIVQAGGTNARFTVANVAARVGGTNRFGGWTIVVVYRNDLQPMRNLTVFNGLSNVSGSNPISDITVSGFLTPLSGPVTFEVGNVTFDGDRSSTGDQLMFNGGSGFVNISDAVNPLNDIFNSTLSYNGVQKTTPFINPGYTNSLGVDADIFIPNNAAKNYIGNSATSATLRLTTGGETFLTQVVTMAIDVYEPDLRAGCRVVDLNGGSVLPGDILEYTVAGKNIGSDPSVNTFITDTLEFNAVYVPGSLSIISGPNTGAKTDAAGDDQAEYIAASRTIRVRAGTGANAVTGGQMNNSPLGVDSTVFRFRVTATTDCIILGCDNIINNRAYIRGTGNVSGNTWSNGSNPNIFDINGCPVPGTTNTPISAAGCPVPSAGSNSPVCTGNTISLTTAPPSSSSTYSWTGPGGFVSTAANPNRANATAAMAGTYTCVITPPGGVCSFTVTTVVVINTTPATPAPSSNTPVCTGNTINLSTAAVAGATYSWTGPSAFASAVQNPTRPAATVAMAGTYSVTVTANGCTSGVGTTVVVVNTTPATPTASSNTPVCTGNTINLSTPAVAGATYSWTGPSAFASAVQNPTRTNATVAMAGTYSVTVTTNGCTSGVGTTAVVVNTTPATPAPSSNSPVCTGNTINLSTAAVAGATYSWTGPNSFVSSVQNPTITNATTAMSGTYSVTVTANGCTSSLGTVAVVVNATPATPTASSNSPVCTGGTLILSTPAVAGATYSWTGPNLFFSAVQNPIILLAAPANSGTYSVTVTVNGCTSGVGTTVVVVNNPPLIPSASSNSPVCTGNTINLSTPAVVGATYSWTGPNAFVSTAQNPSITNATVAMAGTYSVNVTVGGCTSLNGTTSVTVNTTPATPSAGSNSPVCTGNTINLTTPAVGGATYSWTGPNSFVSSVQNPSITNATVAMAGTYSVTVTVNGCTSAAGTIPVVVNTTPATPTASSNTPVCTGNTINLSTPAVPGATYSWTGPSAFASAVQNPSRTNATVAMAGTYSVTVTTNGCTSGVGTTAVVVNTTPATPSASSNSPVCSGNTINLSTPAVAGATYSWTGPNSFVSAVQNPSITNATVAMAGTYSVTVTTSGCTSAAGTVAVVVNATPATPTPGSNSPVCTGNTINLTTAAVAGATYSWTGPNSFVSSAQNPSIINATVAMSGTYSLTVTTNGCTSAVGTVAVTVSNTPSTPTASSNTPVCVGNTINLSTPTVVGATYTWTGPAAFSSSVQNPSRTNATLAMAGTYSVTVTVGGCTSGVGTTAVVVNPSPATPTAGSNSPVCSGNTINLTTPAVASATYSWTGPNSFVSSAQNPTITNATTAMSGTYSVTVTVSGCTSAAGTVAVVVNATPATPAPGSNSPVCTGNTINLTTATVPGATYSWTGPNSFSSSLQNPTRTNATVAMAGTYSLTVTTNGCTSAVGTVNVIINVTPSAPTAGSNSPVCSGNTINLTTPTVVGATYSWTGPNSFVSSVQNPGITNATTAMSGTYSVTVTVSGCTSAAGTVAVIVNATPATPAPGSNSPVCTGNAINLTGPATTGTYTWTGPNSFTSSVQNPTISNATLVDAGTYTLVITESGCPSAIGTVNVVVNATPAAPTAGSNTPVCEGFAINLTSTATTGTYTWTGPNGFTSALQNPSITPATLADAGTYSVTVTENGCTSAFGTTAVVVNPTPAVPVASGSSPVCATQPIMLFVNTVPGATYTWTGPNSFTSSTQNPVIPNSTLAMSGTYSVTVTVNGCVSPADTITITVVTCADQDGDGIIDLVDLDDDNDGVTDVVEGTGDTDGDGIIDALDLDSDNDGITDVAENSGVDTDGNGMIDGFVDIDGNGLADIVDPAQGGTAMAALDNDNDGIPNYMDLDSDNDGIVDVVETGGVDANNDGQVDATADANNNGLDDSVDPATSGTPQLVTGADTNADGLADSWPVDNTDTNGNPNFLDIDSDNDGIVDNIEAQSTAGYIAPSGTDADGDGIDDAYDAFVGFGGAGVAPVNTDAAADGADYIDLDSDNDTMVDALEGWDTDNNGVANTVPSGNDADGDGLDDAYDTNNAAWNPTNGQTPTSFPNLDNAVTPELDWREIDDNDNDGIVDVVDPDDDNDGVLDINEGPGDTDGDGIADAFDLDSDNDGIPDVIEAGGSDPDGDGIIGSGPIADANNNGLEDSVDPALGGTPLLVVDSDNDGVPNYLDLDSDNDGVVDVIEAGGVDANGDGMMDGFVDADADGFTDLIDSTQGGTTLPNPDTDGDGVANVLDLDSDNDGITDIAENGGADTDGNGMVDTFVDADGDGLADVVDASQGGTTMTALDNDGDGIANYVDLDSDNDGILDVTETGGVDANNDGQVDATADANGNGLDDSIDPATSGTPQFTTGADTNNDGLADSYPVGNTDANGQPNYLDIDSDNDGIVDNIEGQSTPGYVAPSGVDADNDGIDDAYDAVVGFGGAGITPVNTDGAADGGDYIDLDSDNDTMMDALEGWDTDNNGTADTTPSGNDADGDGLDDAYDTNNAAWNPTNGQTPTSFPNLDNAATPQLDWRETDDNDGDGIVNALDPDDDNDGITDINEGTGDTDGDGIIDAYDLDSDNDGIADIVESGGSDPDGDGVIGTGPIVDANNNGLDDSVDPAVGGTPILPIDSDNDGVPNMLDLDSDNDGVVDVIEAGGVDANNDGLLDNYVDTDNDGFNDAADSNAGGTPLPTADTDNDGVANFLDLDSDNDGITDVAENGGADTDGNGVIDGFTDADGNGLADVVDPSQGGTAITVADNDGDGRPNYLDLDSDNDGIVDVVEAGGVDANNDGQVDATTDTNNNGLDDSIDPATSGTPQFTTGADTNNDGLADSYPVGNTDANGQPNYLDIDSDNDGIVDNIEGQSTFTYLTPTGVDTDGDGIDDVYDTVVGFGGAGVTPVNTDGATDGPDYLDLDSDNDAMVDALEGWDTNNDGTPDTVPSGNDADGDGLDDAYDTNNAAWNPTNGQTPTSFPNLDNTSTPQLDWRETDDNDGDGITDNNDPDDDNDGILDVNEGPGDTDGDGIVDAFDLDSDNDGIPDVVESGGSDPDGDGIIGSGPIADANNNGVEDSVDPAVGGTPLVAVDTDGDGHPNMYDLDSDNDGIVDVVEAGGTDANNDGMLDNYVDADNDGFNDAADSDAGGTPLATADTDNDNHSDYLDIDADNDGIVDNIEAQPTTGYIAPTGNDTDGDGIDDAYDAFSGFGGAGLTPESTDNTDAPDYIDSDSDNDGFTDLVEGNDFNNDGQPDVAPSGNDADNDGLDDSYDNVSTPGVGNVTNNDAPATGTTFPDVDVVGGELDWRDPVDTDGDGISNADDIDDDNDGILDVTEQLTAGNNGDTDFDGIPDSLDLDSDNDGIADIIEANGSDPDNDGMVGTGPITDANNDGLDDSLAPNGLPGVDTDGDGHPDFQDLDSDNDGINDLTESGGGQLDANSDGVVDGPDTDGDGLPDSSDADNGGNLTNNPRDFDGDGVDDYRDLDSDNDGINDIIESGNGSSDTNGDGIVDGPDTDGDGIRDAVDANDGVFGDPDTNDTPGDFDGDGHPDYNDLDSDNDGINDVEEGGNILADANGDGVVDGIDTDGDGILDVVDLNNGTFGDSNSGTPVDTDGDGHPDYTDLDADNDGINDVIESGNGDLDANGDGVVDGGDADGDGIPDSADADDSNYGDPNTGDVPPDTDGDGIPDYQDLDSDGDGINDVTENGNGQLDTNGDGMIDGNDTDGDGIIDAVDGNVGTYGDTPSTPVDTDGDGTPNYQDLDSDGDGFIDGAGSETIILDCDGDGISNYLDPDPCDLIVPSGFSPNGDGINDIFEIVGISAFPDNKVTIFNRWGNLVYEANGYNNTTVMWDGQNTGALPNGDGPVPEGTYFYVIDLGDGSSLLSGYIFVNRK